MSMKACRLAMEEDAFDPMSTVKNPDLQRCSVATAACKHNSLRSAVRGQGRLLCVALGARGGLVGASRHVRASKNGRFRCLTCGNLITRAALQLAA